MQNQKLLDRAWANMMLELEGIHRRGEEARSKLQELDEKRRVDGQPVEGVIAEYCRCGKKDCPELGTPGHTTRYQLQDTDGATHIPKKRIDEYRAAVEARKLYKQAQRDIEKYERVCERVYGVLGYVSRKRSFESYLLTFTA